MASILEVKQLCKSYNKVKVVENISFQLPSHSCLGLLGPNGAGKSTTMEMIEGLRKPDSGEIYFKGRVRQDRDLEHFGVQFQETALPPQLTVRESLQMFSHLYQNSRKIDDLITLCQLSEFQHKEHNQISGGQRQRLLLAIALCNNPDIILLDEPTTGLDPQARRHLWTIVQDIKAEGKSMILTTHYMDEAQELCDDLMIIDHGKIIAEGSPQSLIGKYCDNVVIDLPCLLDVSKWEEHLGDFYQHENKVEIHTQKVREVLQFLLNSNCDVSKLSVRQSHLEDLFLQLTGRGLRA